MPAAIYRRLTEADYPRLTAYKAQLYSTAAIAQELGCTIAQVQHALRRLGLNMGVKHSRTKPSTVRISWAQYQLTTWHEQRTFSSRYLAERLGNVSWPVLDQELRGTRKMSSRRIATLLTLVRELDPEANLSATLPA